MEAACPLRDGWLDKRGSVCAMEYYSAVKRQDLVPAATAWRGLEGIVLSAVSQTDKYHTILLMCGL